MVIRKSSVATVTSLCRISKATATAGTTVIVSGDPALEDGRKKTTRAQGRLLAVRLRCLTVCRTLGVTQVTHSARVGTTLVDPPTVQHHQRTHAPTSLTTKR